MDSHAVERLAEIRHRQLATLTRADDLARRARRAARGKVMAAQPAVPVWRAVLFRLRVAGRMR